MTKSEQPEVSITNLYAILLTWRWRMLLLTLIALTIAIAASFVIPKKYEAVILLSPVADDSHGGMAASGSGIASSLTGLAALAGFSGASDSQKAESIAILQSEALTEEYIEKTSLLPVLFAKEWDKNKANWKSNDPSSNPTLWKGNQLFKKKIRSLTVDVKTGLVTMSIVWSDPIDAAKWANELVKLANSYQRSRAIEDSERHIAYLTSEANRTDVVGVRQAIYSILQNEISKVMLARGNEEYAFKVLDPAVPPEKPSTPSLALLCLTAVLGSFGLSIAAAFAKAAFSQT